MVQRCYTGVGPQGSALRRETQVSPVLPIEKEPCALSVPDVSKSLEDQKNKKPKKQETTKYGLLVYEGTLNLCPVVQDPLLVWLRVRM